MAITKILARKALLDLGIRYILNGDKTEEQILTAHLNRDPGRECRQMPDTKRAAGVNGNIWAEKGRHRCQLQMTITVRRVGRILCR